MRTDHAGTISVLSVRALAAALGAKGHDVPAALRRVGIDPVQLANAEGRIDVDHAFPLFELACELTGDPHFGLRAPALVPAGSLEALEYALRSCATIRDALAQLTRYFAVLNDRAALHVEDAADSCVVLYTPPPQRQPPRALTEFLFAYLFERGKSFVDRPLELVEVRFRHPAPPGPPPDGAFGGAPVRYGADVDSLTLTRTMAELPLVARDPRLSGVLGRVLEQMVQSLEQKDLLHDVKSAIGAMLPRGAPALDDIAQALGTSGRTLQRRLQQSGTRFTDLVANVQHELSVGYLADPQLTVAEVAYLVGFVDTTSFHRAFRRWTGETPAAARRGSRS